jgi:CheY-like chemotaxis protein
LAATLRQRWLGLAFAGAHVAADRVSAVRTNHSSEHPIASDRNGSIEAHAIDDLKDIPVVVMTAAVVTQAAFSATLGDVALVRKPMSPDELLGAVRRRCGESTH